MRVFLAALLLLAQGCSSDSSAGTSSGGAAGAGGVEAGSDVAEEVPAAPYTTTVFDDVRIGSDQSQPNFQKAEAEIDFSGGPFEKATLVVDLSSTCYPFDNWTNDPPPSGQNWPADCDAFDRNFEFHLDPPTQASDPPGLELERAITPFGGPEHLEVDVTDVANGLPGKHRLTCIITTWSDAAGQVSGSNGGWNVSAHFDMVPGLAPRQVLAVVPLFDDTQTDATAVSPLEFDVPAGTKSSRVELRATGHGGAPMESGCVGPAEEFCLRDFTIYADEVAFTDVQPWRDDCATLCTIAHQGSTSGGFDYCQENPCGAIASVKAPRANWCPGSETPPFTWDRAELATPGKHSFRWQIDQLASGGSWRMSAAFFAFGAPP